MRRITIASLTATLLSAGLLAVAGAAPAAANPCGFRGTLSDRPTTITVGQGDAEPYRTYYVDDRNINYLSDIPEDEAQGIWIYAESNGWTGLQSGGDNHVLSHLPPLPFPPDPIPVLPPDPNRPVFPNGLILFPRPGPDLPELDYHDDCHEYGWTGGPQAPDTLLY